MNTSDSNLSASNLAWAPEDEIIFLKALEANNFKGLEIAPSKFIGPNPYTSRNIELATKKAKYISDNFGILIVSMQSIWFNRDEQLFGSPKERKRLLDYTKQAFEYAGALGCPHVVFGNPKNRQGDQMPRNRIALDFFLEVSKLAEEFKVTVGIEPIPEIYQNSFLTSFLEVKNFIESLDSHRVGLNYDIGSLLLNGEKSAISKEYVDLATHFHLSERNLVCVGEHIEHKKLSELLKKLNNQKWISIEMLEVDIQTFKKVLVYVSNTFDYTQKH